MKAYAVLGLLYATQAEAKEAAKSNGVKFDPVELPFSATPKDEALEYINRFARPGLREEAPAAASVADPVNVTPNWTNKREAEIQRNLDIAEEILNASYEEARKFQAMATERMVECLAEMWK